MDKILEKARKQFDAAEKGWAAVYAKAKEDLDFLSDDPRSQWDDRDYTMRINANEPIITIDQMDQFINQTVNDIRQNTPHIKVIPAGDGDEETAEVFAGLIRHIENKSDADTAYDTAVYNSVACGIGWIRIDHDYRDNKTFEQELCIERVVNPLAVYIDPTSTRIDGSDAKYGFVLDSMDAGEFKEKYKGKAPVSFSADAKVTRPSEDGDEVVIAEYFVVEEEVSEIGITAEGTIEQVQDGVEYMQTREIPRKVVYRYKLSGEDVLEKTTFPGIYVPLIPVYGKEAWLDGKRNLHSLIRKAKPAQRMFNLWKSIETQILMGSSRAAWMAAEGTVDDFREDYIDPNKAAVLQYKQTDLDGNQSAPPQQVVPPQIPQGIVNAGLQALENMKGTMGIYNSALGQRSNETSGVAIRDRKVESDIAVYHFGDNLSKSIQHAGRVTVNAIPVVYNESRVIQIIGEEEEPRTVGINGQIIDGEDEPKTYDLSAGRYDVKVITGASYTTKRQESADFLSQIIASQPQLMELAGDILFKNMDFPGAPALSERMKKLLPPALQQEQKEIDPEKIVMAEQIEGLQGQIAALSAELTSKQQEIAVKREQIRQKDDESVRKYDIELRQLELERMKIDNKLQEAQREYELKEAELIGQGLNAALDEAEAVQEIGASVQMQPLEVGNPADITQTGVNSV